MFKVVELSKAVIDSIVQSYRAVTYETIEIDEAVRAHQQLYDSKMLILDQKNNAFKYNLSFNNVFEESTESLEKTLLYINEEIKRAYETKTSPNNLKQFCRQLSRVIVVQGTSKNHPLPSCD